MQIHGLALSRKLSLSSSGAGVGEKSWGMWQGRLTAEVPLFRDSPSAHSPVPLVHACQDCIRTVCFSKTGTLIVLNPN